jgi:hypothetical protein
MGARVVIGGQPKQGKTTLALHLAEAARAAGWLVVWLAYDEPPGLLTARRLQRRGVSPAVAAELPVGEVAKLQGDGLYVVGSDDPDPYEELARQAHADARGRPVLIVGDSAQKLRTRAGAGKGERERITADVDAIQASQAKWPHVAVLTSEIARGSGATKGSGSIDYAAEVSLRVARKGATVRVSIAGNRYGGEEPFALELDSERQTLRDPTAPAPKPTDEQLLADVMAAVDAGCTSRNAIAARLGKGRDAVAAAIKQLTPHRLVRLGQELQRP